MGDATGAAYWCGDMFTKRAKQMQTWADCTTPPKVTKLRKKTA
jgi:hypothetical protein